jgi:hypothetical protein
MLAGASLGTSTDAFVAVGLGQAAAVKSGDSKTPRGLVAYGLGSCVAICLFDPTAGVAGMAHVVLPGTDPSEQPNPKFAGSALPALVREMAALGSSRDMRRFHATRMRMPFARLYVWQPSPCAPKTWAAVLAARSGSTHAMQESFGCTP